MKTSQREPIFAFENGMDEDADGDVEACRETETVPPFHMPSLTGGTYSYASYNKEHPRILEKTEHSRSEHKKPPAGRQSFVSEYTYFLLGSFLATDHLPPPLSLSLSPSISLAQS